MRKLECSNGQTPPTSGEVEALEVVLGQQLPEDLREFFSMYNGGVPREALFVRDDQAGFLIGYFIPLSVRSPNPSIPTVAKFRIWDRDWPGEEPKLALPLARDWGESLLLYSFDAQTFGQIFYYHPDVDPGEKHLRFLAPSLNEFLAGLVEPVE